MKLEIEPFTGWMASSRDGCGTPVCVESDDADMSPQEFERLAGDLIRWDSIYRVVDGYIVRDHTGTPHDFSTLSDAEAWVAEWEEND